MCLCQRSSKVCAVCLLMCEEVRRESVRQNMQGSVVEVVGKVPCRLQQKVSWLPCFLSRGCCCLFVRLQCACSFRLSFEQVLHFRGLIQGLFQPAVWRTSFPVVQYFSDLSCSSSVSSVPAGCGLVWPHGEAKRGQCAYQRVVALLQFS